MNKFAIIGARKAPRTGCVAIISGALLGAVAAAGPAQSGDLGIPYQYTGYRYWPGYVGYNRNCYSCGCYRCGCYRCGVARNYGLVAERHWVERDYWERRYPVAPHYPLYGYRYPYPGPYYSWEAPRPHLGYGGIAYPPAPISYEYDPPSRPLYDEAAVRPPAGIPGAYSNAGYVEPGSLRPGIPGGYYNAGYLDEGAPRPPAGVPYSNAGYIE